MKKQKKFVMKTPSNRLSPHSKLSRTAIRKRLYQAGVRSTEINRIAAEISAGSNDPKDCLGQTALGWNVEAFKQRFGSRVARSVLRFVQKKLVVQDEYWKVMNSPAITDYLRDSMSHARNAMVVNQQSAHDFDTNSKSSIK
jgi:hypothetical protein